MCDFAVDIAAISVFAQRPPEFLLADNTVLGALADDGVVTVNDGVVRL